MGELFVPEEQKVTEPFLDVDGVLFKRSDVRALLSDKAATVAAETLACCQAVCPHCAAGSIFDPIAGEHGINLKQPCRAVEIRKRLPVKAGGVESMAERDEKLRLLHSLSKAPLLACNQALDQARGDFEVALRLAKEKTAT